MESGIKSTFFLLQFERAYIDLKTKSILTKRIKTSVTFFLIGCRCFSHRFNLPMNSVCRFESKIRINRNLRPLDHPSDLHKNCASNVDQPPFGASDRIIIFGSIVFFRHIIKCGTWIFIEHSAATFRWWQIKQGHCEPTANKASSWKLNIAQRKKKPLLNKQI